MRAAVTLTITTALTLVATSAFAQSYSGGGAGTSTHVPIIGSGYHGFGYSSSTAAEGFARGKAEVIRAAGEFNYNTSLALMNREVARSQAIENHANFVATYFELKEANKAFRQQRRIPRLTPEQLSFHASQAAPKRLAAHQLEPVRGTLQWPAALSGDEFAEPRAMIDAALAQRTSGGSVNAAAIAELTRQMQDVLKAQVVSIPPHDYMQAKRFLESVGYEVQFAPADGILAAK